MPPSSIAKDTTNLFNNSFAQETNSIEINESLANLGGPVQFHDKDSAEWKVRDAIDQNEPRSAHQLINDMSYIQNASSNDNLLSPHMFSNNSLSPTNPHFLEKQLPVLTDKSLGAFSPHEAQE